MIKTLLSTTAILLAIAHANAQAAPVLDLTTAGSSGFFTEGEDFYTTNTTQPTGSGVIHSFVRISENTNVVQGYNTDARPVSYNENTSPTFTRSLLLSNVNVVDIGGEDYYQFLLDINQTAEDPLLSLNELEIYLGPTANHSGTGFGTGAATVGDLDLVYDLDATGDNRIELNYNLNHGSGSGDMFAYINTSLFTGTNQYVYLYSSFGVPNINNDGYEEWAAFLPQGVSAVPEPSTIVTALAGLLPLGIIGLRRRLRRKGGVPV